MDVWAFQVALVVKNLPASAGDIRDIGLIPGLGRCWRNAWQRTSVFLPGKSHGRRNLAGCGTQHCKESDMTEAT